MKKIIVALTLFLPVALIAQKPAIPESAKASFTKTYPAATKIKWEKEDGNYEVTFIDQGNELSAIYNAKGLLLESEHEMKPGELPASITAYMKEHYKGIAVKGAAKITKADGSINYEAAIKGKDVLFDANGRFIKEVKD